MRGLRLAGAFGFAVLVATGCAVGIVGDPVDTESDGSVSTPDASSTATALPPDGSSPDASVKDGPVGTDVVVPPTDSGGDSGACNGKLVINEVQTEGTSADHEFVEIYNTGTCDVSLEGWSLKYSASSGSAPSTFFDGLISHKVLARGHFVVACSPFPGAKNATYMGGQLAADNGQVGLFNKLGIQVDAVGYGTITTKRLTEGNPAPTPGGPGKSVQRIPNGNDTDNNQADFRSANSTANLAN